MRKEVVERYIKNNGGSARRGLTSYLANPSELRNPREIGLFADKIMLEALRELICLRGTWTKEQKALLLTSDNPTLRELIK